jgi:predicted phosphodiesterase
MRIAVLSDIHGNYEALQAVVADMDEGGVETVICLGDMISYGPESERCVSRVREMGWPTVMGNHELGLKEPSHMRWFNPQARKSLQQAIRTLSEASVSFISALPPCLVAYGCRFVHGFPPDSPNIYLFGVTDAEIREAFSAIPEPISFVGHTHLIELIDYDGRSVQRSPLGSERIQLSATHRYLVNVGSVGQPRDPDRNAKYVIHDTEAMALELRRVPYDVDTVVEKIRQAGLPEAHALRLQ